MYNSSSHRNKMSATRSIMINTGNVIRPLLSNRCSLCISNVYPIPTLHADTTVGVDRIAVEIPLVPSKSVGKALLSTIKNTQLGRWGAKATAVHEATGTKVHFQFNRARWSITMEFNPSRFMDPDGTSLTPIDSVARITELLIEEYFAAGEALPAFAVTTEGDESLEYWEETWRSQIRIIRLDGARDFRILDPLFSIELFKETKAKFARAVSIIYNKGRAETWDSPSSKKNSHVKFYDKTAHAIKKKHKNIPEEGTYRFEYLMRNKHLQRHHIHTLEDLTPEKFEAALRYGWGISKLGEPVNHEMGWVKMVHDSTLPPYAKAQVIGMLYANEASLDLNLRPLEKKSIKRFAKNAGISFRRPLKKQGNLCMRLDLETGTAITEKNLLVHTDVEEDI